jgi:hypothetical protein
VNAFSLSNDARMSLQAGICFRDETVQSLEGGGISVKPSSHSVVIASTFSAF